jgi:DNA-binding transcriptional LysR family regulator
VKPLTLQRLQVFCTVYEHHSITAAARVMKLSQPTVSRHLRDFEAALGLTLFVLDKGRVLPTAEADAIYTDSRFLDDGISRLERRIESLRKGTGTRLPVMSVGLFAPHFVPTALRRTLDALPGLRITLDIGTAEQQITYMRAGMVEIGLVVGKFAETDIVAERIGEGRLVVLTPEGGPLTRLDRVRLEDLVSVPMLGLTARGPLGRVLSEALVERGLAYSDTITGNSLVSVPHLVKAFGRSAVVDEFTAALHGVPGLVTLPLETDLPIEINAITMGADAQKTAIQIFVREMRALLADWAAGERP